jgi:transcriptional regulator with XRE-family HTH domain
MPKPTYTKEELLREGALLGNAIDNSSVKMSQEDCMGLIGMAQGNLSQWRKGQNHISDRNLVFVADVYKFDALRVRPDLKLFRDYFAKFGILANLDDTDRETVMRTIHSMESKRKGEKGISVPLSPERPESKPKPKTKKA